LGELGKYESVTSGDMFDCRNAEKDGTKLIKNALFIKAPDFARSPELLHCPTSWIFLVR
jgi:hypothetical protein